MKIYISVIASEGMRIPHSNYRSAAINPDGSFHVKGLSPGKARMDLFSNPVEKAFSVLRVERGGVDQKHEVEIGADQHITDVRVIVGYGSARIRGQMNFEGGKLPADATIRINAWRVTPDHAPSHSAGEVAPDGRFIFENLMTGEYEIMVSIYRHEGDQARQLASPLRKKVSVTNGAETEITLVIDLSAKNKEQN
jgi:hypothetical protein